MVLRTLNDMTAASAFNKYKCFVCAEKDCNWYERELDKKGRRPRILYIKDSVPLRGFNKCLDVGLQLRVWEVSLKI